ncbi:MAG TPA: MotA/TolQ/ExbB proton channel family protein [Candidatus Hydrogenedentes bacterium]|nr:MotA/TolQ/ExbB proton channel family protein [Candidatus Hydrogenedentota bacterium]
MNDFEPYDLMKFIQQGGVLMWPILACSIVALAVALERFFRLSRARKGTREFLDALREVLRNGRAQDAITLCDEADAPLGRIMKAGLLKSERSKSDIKEAIEGAGRLEVPRLERYLSALATCITVAPMLGLLGTVQGMIKCFVEIEHKGGQVNPSDLAEGIGNALITTGAGLAVAIPALIAYNYLVTMVQGIVLELEVSSSEMLDLIALDSGDR